MNLSPRQALSPAFQLRFILIAPPTDSTCAIVETFNKMSGGVTARPCYQVCFTELLVKDRLSLSIKKLRDLQDRCGEIFLFFRGATRISLIGTNGFLDEVRK